MGENNDVVWTKMADDWASRFEHEAESGEYGMACNHVGKGDLDPARDYILRKIGFEGLVLETFKGKLKLTDGVDGEDIADLYRNSQNRISKEDMLKLVKKTFAYIDKLQAMYRQKQKEVEAKQNPPKRVNKKWYQD